MSWFDISGIEIVGIASAVPVQKIGKEENIQRFGHEDVEKFIKNTGIESIHRTTEFQTAGDLGYEAAKDLIEKLSVNKSEIGCLVFVTQSPDYRRPNTACVIQNRLELGKNCVCLDVNHGCAGFAYGHMVIESMMASSDMKYGLLITGETTGKIAGDYSHSAMMFGDAGAAVLYKKTDDKDTVHQMVLGADGKRFKAIILPAGGFRDMNPDHEKYICHDGVARDKYEIFMNGVAVFGFSIMDVNDVIKNFLSRTGTSIQDYDLCAFHQANYFILKQLAKRLSIPHEKLAVSLDRYGNTSNTSIPLTLCDRYGNEDSGRKKILAAGFGIGLAWGVTAFSIDTRNIFPVIETDNYYHEGRIDMSSL